MRVLTCCLVAVILAACGSEEANRTTTGQTSSTSTPTSTEATTSSTTSTLAADTTSTTAPGPAGALLVVGDWGSGTMPQGAVAGAMARYAEQNPVEAILTTGDNFYSDNVDLIMTPFDWALGADIPFWITWGNHDVETATRADALAEVFDDPPRWDTHRWGRVEIVILDSTQVENPDQLEFYRSELERIDGPTVVVFHHPALTCSREPSRPVLETWVPEFDAEVDLVLSGHEHNFQRFEVDDRTYVVTGGGGAAINQIDSCPAEHPATVAEAATHHFIAVQQDSTGMTLEVIDTVDQVIDSFRVPFD